MDKLSKEKFPWLKGEERGLEWRGSSSLLTAVPTFSPNTASYTQNFLFIVPAAVGGRTLCRGWGGRFWVLSSGLKTLWRAKKMPVLALFWRDQIPPSHVHCFLLQTCRFSEDRIRREEAVWLVLIYERMNSVSQCSLESFKNLKYILVRYTLIKYFKHLWDLKVILIEFGGLFSKRKINTAYPVYK